MNFQNISAWSIRNPIVPLVLFAALLLAGMVSFARMHVVNQPDVQFPMVTVTVVQPGAAPSEIENQVTQIVESAVRSISGVKTINSSVTEGNSTTTIEFEVGEDINAAVAEVKNAVDQSRSELPDGILEPRIVKMDTISEPIGFFAIEATDMTMEQLSWFVDDTVKKRLLAIEGMAEVQRNGGVDREIRVTLDPQRMQSLGVTASQVNQILRQVNVDATGGTTEIGGVRQSVRVLGNADDAYDLSQRLIALGNGRAVKLADIAEVRDSFSEQKSLGKVGDKQVVTISLSRARNVSDVTVYDNAVAVMEEIENENPGIVISRLGTSVDMTKSQYSSSMAAMVEGALLAVVVVFLFLRDWRATIISAIAIPLSAIPTFWFMDLLGFSLNSLSLLALSLVAGVLVDDAIVEIENIVRHMRMGKSAYQAAIDAADEIGLAVVATTFTIVAVFLPVGLMPGISGQFFKNFGLTVVAAVMMSLAVARMISPMIAAYFLKAHGQAEHGGGPVMDYYMKALHWSLDHRWKMMGVALLALIATVVLLATTPMQFFPNVDRPQIVANAEFVPGTTLEQAEEISSGLSAILDAQPETEITVSRVFPDRAVFYVLLKTDRARTSIELMQDLAPQLEAMADARVSFTSQGPRSFGGAGRDIDVMLTGSNPELLETTALEVVEQMKGIPLIRAPRISADMRRPELIIEPRMDLAASLGVTTGALSQAIRIATIGEIDQNAAKFSLSDRQVPIRVMLSKDARSDMDVIRNLPVATSSGGSVPLERVANIRFGSGPTSIQRFNQERRMVIGADLAPGAVSSDATNAINALPLMKNLPTGISTRPFGAAEAQGELVTNFVIAVISGILLVFAVLVLLYKRFMSPLVNLGSLLLAPLGGVIAIKLLGHAISMPVMIGFLMLLGIVAKNSILLIDFALEEMAKGVAKYDAIIDAGHKRAQPIVMTTIAMTAGMVPTTLSLSGDSAWRAPMGACVIGGLLMSTVLTLAIVPAAFSLADDLEKWLGPKLGRLLTYSPGDHLARHAAPDAAE